MSVHEKAQFWGSQFKIALPYKLAVHFVAANRDRIEKDFLSISCEQASHWTRGKYGRSDIGSYVVRASGYVQEILGSLKSPVEQMILQELDCNPPSTNYEFWRKMQQVDPQHPAFLGELWCQDLATELGEVVGEYLASFRGEPNAVGEKLNEMQRSSRQHKQIAAVMES